MCFKKTKHVAESASLVDSFSTETIVGPASVKGIVVRVLRDVGMKVEGDFSRLSKDD